METVTLKALQHKGVECIGIFSSQFRLPSGEPVNYYYQKKAGAKWSRTNKCWYIPCTEKNYELLCAVLKGRALLEVQELKKYLLERKKHRPSAAIQNPGPATVETIIKTYKPIPSSPVQKLSAGIRLSTENNEALQKFKQQLVLKSYSASTIRTYTNEFIQFLQAIKNNSAAQFSVERIKDYLQYCHEKLKLSENTLHSRINSLKFYYEQVLYKEKFFWEIPRPKKRDQLPKVLAEIEIGRMFNAVKNIKHKAILFTAYSAGLRVSEVVNLKIKDVDSERMQLRIENSKGKKDRYVGLSILLLDILRQYLKGSNPMPKKYVFENPLAGGEPYSVRSAQQIFQNAKEKAMINKSVGIHSLRHSFATHLLEKGIDIRYIKDLLGHFNIKTTERYLHVKKETLVNIPNVLDELNKTITLEW
ncbi:MAG: tyrosine-type recombinase/integrase [Bacteroidota bacterium]|nr:tyrosine-type recombinase/integrase [Bacteroidota bacterium]